MDGYKILDAVHKKQFIQITIVNICIYYFIQMHTIYVALIFT